MVGPPARTVPAESLWLLTRKIDRYPHTGNNMREKERSSFILLPSFVLEHLPSDPGKGYALFYEVLRVPA